MSCADPALFVLAGSEPLRELLQQVLRGGGFRPAFLATAAEYFARVGEQRAACLVVDAELPDMSAAEFQRKAPVGHPVVFVSCRRDIVESVRAMKAGAIDYLVAPIDAAALLRAVQAAVENCREAQVRRARLAELQQRYARLTPRERETLQLIAGGMLNKQAAFVLGIREATLQVHRGRIIYKMKARSFAELIRMADTLDVTASREWPARFSVPQERNSARE